MARLVVKEGAETTAYDLADQDVVIGRDEGAKIRLRDPKAGKLHCRIAKSESGYHLVDLESRNGTKVNGAFVNQCRLQSGDVIQIGDARIRFSGTPQVPPPQSAVPAAPAARSPVERRVRHPRPPRRRSSNPYAPLIIVLTLVVAGVLSIVFINSYAHGGRNQRVLSEMKAANANGDYGRVLQLAKEADPQGDSNALYRIRALEHSAERSSRSESKVEKLQQAGEDFSVLEGWVMYHRSDVKGVIARYKAFIREHPGTSEAAQAQKNIDAIQGPRGASKVERDLRFAVYTAKRLAQKDRYGDAIQAVLHFWDQDQLLAGSKVAMKSKVDREVQALKDQAEKRWNVLDSRAKSYEANGDYDDAIEVYKQVAKNFGMEKYTNRAIAGIRRLEKE